MKKPVEKRTGTLLETRGSGDYAKVLAGVTELLDAARRASARGKGCSTRTGRQESIG